MSLSIPPSTRAGAGVFIAIEGGDGAGKSTQAELLADWVRAAGREVVRTREPGGTTVGTAIRQVLLHGEDVAPRAEALLFAADRAHHVATVVRPALQRGAVVITDRYLDSSVAYQSAARGLEGQEVRDLSLWATESLLPDLTVVLDLPTDLGRGRIGSDPDRLEREGDVFHQRVRQGFLDLAASDPSRYLVLDASGPVDDLHRMVVDRVGGLLHDASGGER